MEIRAQRFAVAFALACGIAVHPMSSGATQRTFVASTGNDAGTCSISQPCRSFGAAAAKTDAKGEVIVLDSAGYGNVTLTKSVSIIAPPGIYAGISVFAGAFGIKIDDTSSTENFALRGLTINGQGGEEGIVILHAAEVDIESCVIANLQDDGISNNDTTANVRIVGSTLRSNGVGATMVGGQLQIENSEFDSNQSDGLYMYPKTTATIRGSTFTRNGRDGLVIPANSFQTTIAVSETEFSANVRDGITIGGEGSSVALVSLEGVSASANGKYGVFIDATAATANANVSISGSRITLNGADGVHATSPGTALVTIADSTINENGSVGVYATGAAGVIVGLNHNTIARNGDTDIQQVAPAVIRTFGNNALTGNASGDITGSLVPVTAK